MKSGQLLHKLLHGKRLLIFDFDGTVADTSPLHAKAFNQALSSLGVTVDYPSIAGLSTSDAMRQCLTTSGLLIDNAELDALVIEKQKKVRQMMNEGLTPLPGVDKFLRWARSRYYLSMATSGSRGTVQLALTILGYENWFEPLVCSDDVQKTKPDPESFLEVLRITGITAAESLVFEDSPPGFSAAREAGLEFIDVNTGILQAYILDFGANHGY